MGIGMITRPPNLLHQLRYQLGIGAPVGYPYDSCPRTITAKSFFMEIIPAVWTPQQKVHLIYNCPHLE